MKKKKMVVIRAIRESEGIYYNAFSRLNIKFLTLGPEKKPYPIKLKNVKFNWLPQKPACLIDPIRIFNFGRYSARSWLRVDEQILRKEIEDVDVINISDTYYFWWYRVAKLAKEKQIPLVTIVWEITPGHLSAYLPPYSQVVREVVNTTRLFILKTKRCHRYTNSLGIPRSKTRVVYQGLDLDLFRPPKEKRNDKVRILYVGQLIESKGINELLEAYSRLSAEFDNLELLITGGGPLEKRVGRLSRQYPIRYLGFVPYIKLPQVYQQADIFCMPSKDYKYFGFLPGGEERGAYTLLEAMATGLPVVTAKCGTNPEIVGKENIIVGQGDVEGLYQALRKLVLDPGRRLTLGKNNRRRAEELFELKTQARKMEDAILGIL